jgi:hypothetical protein
MTLVGRKLDNSLNSAGGRPYSFRLHGEPIHRVGSLLPAQGENPAPVYAQLYISNSVIAANAAYNHHMGNAWNSNLNGVTLHKLQDMLFHHHPGVQHYKQAFKLTRGMPQEQQCQIALCFDAGCDRHCYQAPDASVREIAVILLGDGEGSQDIILYCNHGEPLQHSSDTLAINCYYGGGDVLSP